MTKRPPDASDGAGPAGQDETAAIRLRLDELLGQRGGGSSPADAGPVGQLAGGRG